MRARQTVLLLLTGLLAGAADASAADGGKPKTALPPVQGLAACGRDGFTLPGSTTCIRLGGSVTSTTILRSGSVSAPAGVHDNLFSSHVVGRVSADVRVQTELGPLRAYTSLRVPVGENGPR